MDVAIGTMLGGYTLIRKLGSGGMGTVYLAEDQTIGQQVAIKVIRTDRDAHVDSLGEAQATELFRREARAVAGLDHLHILPLYRYGEEEADDGQRAYMVMQYRPEGSLWDWLRHRANLAVGIAPTSSANRLSGLPETWPLPVEEAAVYIRQAASALQYAHDRGIVHRDVKPANFLLRFDAQSSGSTVFLLLSDFGLAKFYATTSASSTIFGTPTYMAPEQFEGIVGPESDQYALAIMAYYLLAGRPPFEGEPMRLMHQHLSVAPPPLRNFAPRIPMGAESVLQRALAKKPGERYPSITIFADAFSQSIQQTLQPDPATQPTIRQDPSGIRLKDMAQAYQGEAYNASTVLQSSGQNIPALPTTPVQSGIGFAATVYTPADHAPSTAPGSLILKGPSSLPSQAPAALAVPRPPEPQPLERRSILGWVLGGAALVAAGAGLGTYLYTNQRPDTIANNTYPGTIPPRRPTPATLRHNVLSGHSAEVTGVSWAPNGIHLASSSKDGTVRLWDSTSLQTTLVYQGHRQIVQSVAWGPAGQQLASGGATIQIWNPNGKLTHPLFNTGGLMVNSLSWQPDEAALFAATVSNLQEIKLATNTITPRGNKSSHHAITISPNGRYIAVGGDPGLVTLYSLPDLQLFKFMHLHPLTVRSLAWSHDSQLLASTTEDRTARIWNIATDNVQVLTHTSAVYGISWEPGSTNRLATASANGALNIWTLASNSHISYPGHSGPCTAVEWGTSTIATGSTDKTVIIWRI